MFQMARANVHDNLILPKTSFECHDQEPIYLIHEVQDHVQSILELKAHHQHVYKLPFACILHSGQEFRTPLLIPTLFAGLVRNSLILGDSKIVLHACF